MNRPCKAAITCPGTDAPIMNLSAEAPDLLTFFSIIYAPPPHVPLGGDPDVVYQSVNCYGVTFSGESQAQADLLARLSGAICKQPTAQQFTNDPQTASITCPAGSIFSITIPAGSITVAADPDPEAWIAASNAAALALAEQQASELSQRCCLNTTSLNPHPGWMCLGQELVEDIINRYEITGLNAEGIWNFTVTGGQLPPGTFLLTTGNNTAQLFGIPHTVGVYTFTIQAIRPAQPLTSISVTDTINVLGITNPTLPDGQVGTPYDEQLQAAGGTPPFTFTLIGTLPPGLSMDSSGHITGTPT